MNSLNYTRNFFLALLVMIGCTAMAQAQNVEIVEVSGVHTVDIDKDTGPDLDWGETKVGTAVRARVEFTNNRDEAVKLVRVLSDQGCFPVGNRIALQDLEVKPGKSQDFFIFARAEETGTYSYKVELILENQEGIRERVAVFNYKGMVVAGE